MFIDVVTGGLPDHDHPENTILNPQWIAQEAQLNSSIIDNTSSIFDNTSSTFNDSSISSPSIETWSAPSYYDFNSGL
jgi:hypothetical protein